MKKYKLNQTATQQALPTLLLSMFVSGIVLLVVSGYFVWNGRAAGNLLLTSQGQSAFFAQIEESTPTGKIISDTEVQEQKDLLGDFGSGRVVEVSWEANLSDSERSVQDGLRIVGSPPLACFSESGSTLECQVNFSAVRIGFSQQGSQTIGTFVFPRGR